MPSQSAGDRTSYSTGRVDDSESISNAALRSSPKNVQRSHSGRNASQAAISMNVANASFSQMPFHHPIVTRSPNHMCASSWATTSATSCRSLWVRGGGVDQQQVLAERDAAEVLHRPGGEVGQRDQVDLVARDRGCRSSPGTSAGRRRRHRGRTRSGLPCPATCTIRIGIAVDIDPVGRLERTDHERHEVRTHHHRVGEPDHGRPSALMCATDLRPVRHGHQTRVRRRA